jgi:hypothetical protein
MKKNFATLILAQEFFPLKLSEFLAKVLKKQKNTQIVEKLA